MQRKNTLSPWGVFITGTDTGVGKTFISLQLIRALNKKGIDIIPRKPVESGCERVNNQLRPADALAMQTAMGQSVSLSEICPYMLEHALSPERAARLEGIDLKLQVLQTACRVSSKHFLLVEGAGGFYSPLASDGLVADLAQRLRLPVLLVAVDRLGCINQVLLNVQAIESRGLLLAAIVLNALNPPTDPNMDNWQDLRTRLHYPVIRFGHVSEESGPMTGLGISPIVDLLTNEKGKAD